MRKTLLLATLLMVALAVSSRSRKKQPATVQVPPTIEIINRVNNHWQQGHKPQVRAFWDEAAYHTGNMEAYRLLGKAEWLDYSTTWARHNRWMGAREQDPAKWKYKQYGEGQDYVLFGDWQICFQTYLDLFAMNPDAYKISRAIEVMDYEVRSPQTDYWWWADALYMVMPVFTKLYVATGQEKYLDKLYQNFCYADSLMFDPEVHLYYRDGRYIYPHHKTDLGLRDFWARGNGWVLAGLAKVLADMPADYKHRPFFEQRFVQLAEAVAGCQQPEGYWSRSMLDAEQAEGPETSGTAFFCYGLLWGMNHGLLSRQQYEPTMNLAWKYLTEKALQPNGAVGFVQPIGDRAVKGQQLSEKNESNFGVGAFLLAACEHLRYEDRAAAVTEPRVVVTISNHSSEFCQQVVAIDAKTVFSRLGIQGGRQFVVLDPAGLELPYQLSYDGQILVDAGVRPKGTLVLTIQRRVPSVYPNISYGQLYPERKDDYAWENDRGAYRVYGPALQQSGEHSFGIDVWSKNTPDLVVEQRYWTEDVVMMPQVERLRKENRQRGDSLYRTISYHHDHGRGMDLYKVGATLGCGAPALLTADDHLVYPYCFKTYSILDNGPLRTTVQLDYQPVFVQGDSVVEHRIISLDKGSNFNRMTVWYDGLTQPLRLATGVVVHSEDKASLAIDANFLAYADPTDNVRVNNCQLFVATAYPEGVSTTCLRPFDQPRDGNEGHLLGIVDNYSGQPYTYLFGSAWSKYDVRTLDEWQSRIRWTLRQHATPLSVELK